MELLITVFLLRTTEKSRGKFQSLRALCLHKATGRNIRQFLFIRHCE